MKDLMSEFEFYALWQEGIMLFGSNTLFIGESNLGVIENSLVSLGGQQKMYQIKKTPPPTHDFMNERSLKLTNIFNLNRLKFSIPVSTRAEI